ncbi:TolC family protein [Myxococcus stipitatus]|uniref:TolC family protein n=1 Tax=Myxococcus stipitatus TaxID=83455 RepID=UPI0030D06159
MSNLPATAACVLAAALVWPCASTALPSELSFQEALALARTRAPALLEAEGLVAEAQGPVAGTNPLLRENPTLSAEAGSRKLDTGKRGTQFSVGLSQPFELGGKQGARRESAHAGLARQGAEKRDTERRVLGEVGAAFLRALHARELSRLLHETEEAAKHLADATKKRFDAGDVPIVDAHVTRVALARTHAAVAVAEGEESISLSELRALLGLPLEAPLTVRGDLRELASLPVPAPPSAQERPDIVALEAGLAQAEAELRLGRSQRWPDVSVGVRYENEVDETAVLGTLSVPLPVFSRGQEETVTQDARVRRLRTALEMARRAREVQVEAARIRDAKRQQALEVLVKDALPLLDENEALARKSYEAGEMDLAELLLVRRETLETRVALLDSHLQAALARVQLAVETGVLP